MLHLCATACLLAAVPAPEQGAVRVAVFNVWELSREKLDRVGPDGRGADPQLRGAAEILQRVRPDILLVNEIDFDRAEAPNAASLFRDRYLQVSQVGLEPLDYPHLFAAPVNTGVPAGKDFDNDGRPGGPADCYGYGTYPGQYGMAVYSKFPLKADQARTFQKLLWVKMPGNLCPDGTDGKPAFYSPDEAEVFRLSSKSHWDLPVEVNGRAIHLLCSHPTPPVFDGPEDHNGRRNHDEIRLWADYLTGGEAAGYIRDDAGKAGGLPAGESFVLLGDLNAAPTGDLVCGKLPIAQLLSHPRIRETSPAGEGSAPEPGGDRCKTCDFGRIDYALPSRDLGFAGCGVFWPAAGDPLARLVADRAASSDHRLVYVDIKP